MRSTESTYETLASDALDPVPISRPKLIFRAQTAVGLVSIWKSHRAACVIYDIHVEEAGAGMEIERQRLTRTSAGLLRHILFSSDGATSFQFLEDAIGFQPA